MSDNICARRVAAVTGAGRGIGRAHALALAQAGAAVVVNDVAKADEDPAALVVQEIRAAGGRAVANHDDISTEDGAHGLIDAAVQEFGTIDVLLNNAGNLRDNMLFNMTSADFDAVLGVHLRGTFLTSSYAASIWRARVKQGETVDARIINTTSVAGLYGNVGQANYGSAKAGIAAFTIIASKELARYGVTANAISPAAATRMTEHLVDAERAATISPDHVAKVAVWLSSPLSASVTGRIIHVGGRQLSIPEGWRPGPGEEVREHASAEDVGAVIVDLLTQASPNRGLDGSILEEAP